MSIVDLSLSFLRRLDAERAHRITVWALARGLVPRPPAVAEESLRCRLFGLDFPNPVGIAAGFDKDAEAFAAVLGLGFGFVEVGTVTPRPQAGNARPRLFRLAEDAAVINRMGFNNAGMEAAAGRLSVRATGAGIVGANIGRNKDSADATADYAACAARLAPLSDYLVVNVSSPNTPGLRALQSADALAEIVRSVRSAATVACGGASHPLLVKIAPDLTEADLTEIAAVARNEGIDGLIVANTTVSRPPGLQSRHREEGGGLSGQPLFQLSTAVLASVYRLTQGQVPLIGVGGIASGAQAYAKIRAGASLVQLYTGLVYRGPRLVGEIRRELAARLAADGFANVAEAVGADHR